ncbi:MAG TPA: sigma-70 family RNA polymerase sigma factor [Acetobacteraceae bacterium]|jgi:RNA polymerase sigma-70 factor (ECF subfamily)|nr:sigma-70 family RNA polymerase sigma factor [Acetobacteraceae bacterium]
MDTPDAAERRRGELMAAAQAGDGAAYAALLRDCLPTIRAIARRRGLSPDRAEDAVQEVLLTIHRVRHTYDPSRPFSAWLRAITERRVIDALRRDGRRQAREVHDPIAMEAEPDGTPEPGDAIDAIRQMGQVRAALASLPPRQREAVEQIGLRGRSLAEAAEATGRTKVTLKVNLHRALKTLRTRIGGDADA